MNKLKRALKQSEGKSEPAFKQTTLKFGAGNQVIIALPPPKKKAKKEVKNVQIQISTEPVLDLSKPAEKLEQWVEKYCPCDMKSIVEQQTEQSPANKLLRWLKDWARKNLDLISDENNKVVGTSAKTDGTAFRAALLSGPTGIGKTTTATLVCKELGLHCVELSASVARSKKMLEQKVTELTQSRRVDEYFAAQPEKPKPVIKSKEGIHLTHVLIVDEIDCMAESPKCAGFAELIKFIKKSEVPIICICNDRQNQEVRSLANHCVDVRFQHPSLEQIVDRMMTIATCEKLKITKDEVEQIVKASHMDLRQSIYSLQLMSAGQDKRGVLPMKDVSINTFEAARQLLSVETSIARKQELFFTDYHLIPLFVQENYLNIRSSTFGNDQLRAYRKAAESICMGEMVSQQILSSQNWSLLPSQGMLSSVLPSLYVSGYPVSNVNFPTWFDKQSNMRKRTRLLHELDEHLKLKVSGSLNAILTDYIPTIRNSMLKPLASSDSNSVHQALDVYYAYDLVKEDLKLINELGTWNEQGDLWNEQGDLWKSINPTVKACLTRTLGKNSRKKNFATENNSQASLRTGSKRAAAEASKEKMKAIVAEENEEARVMTN